MKNKVVILGAGGQVGKCLLDSLPNHESYEIHSFNRNELDLIEYENVRQALSEIAPQVVVNCGAYTQVDKAEKDIANAYKSNAYAVGHLAKSCKAIGAKLIHISSDYVYNNQTNLPITESVETNPKSIYAKSKLMGDDLCLKLNPSSFIIRTSWVYSPYSNNFVKTMIKLSSTHEQLKIVNDQYGCPTNAHDLSNFIITIIHKICSNSSKLNFGIYNFTNEGITNWKEFAEEIFKNLGSEIEVLPTTTKEYNAPAHRPLWSVMNLNKIKKEFGFFPRHWTIALGETMQKLAANQ